MAAPLSRLKQLTTQGNGPRVTYPTDGHSIRYNLPEHCARDTMAHLQPGGSVRIAPLMV